MTFKRARRDEQKAERRRSILATARELCAEAGVLHWSLNELGRRAAVAKPNLYRYFGSREEILMTLMHEEIVGFVGAVASRTQGAQLSTAQLCQLLAEGYRERPLLCELLCVSASVLEHHVEDDAIRAIKLAGLQQADKLAASLAATNADLDPAQAHQLAFTSGIVVAGLWPMAGPNAPMQRLSQTDGMQGLALDFEESLEQLLRHYASGLLAQQ